MALTTETILQNIQDIRSGAALFLGDTCQIERYVSSDYINGEEKTTYADSVTIACRLIIRSGNSRTPIASQEVISSETVYTGIYRLQLPYDTIIDERDRIIFEDRIFEIVYIPPFHPMMGAFIIAIQEIK